jgi:hypothetical protein
MSHDSDPFHPAVRNLEEDGKASQKNTIISLIPKIKKVWKELSKCAVVILNT